MSNNKISSQDIKMFIYSLLIFFIEICGCIQQSLLTFGYDIFLEAVASTQWILADVGTIAPVWFILATNKQLRQEIANLFDFGGNIVHNIPIVTVTSMHTR
uniref:Uncharacterized protein n=1 Tax=Panagrolaimus davidi TaxID=227884 RepID=A0A914PPI0_9BILA